MRLLTRGNHGRRRHQRGPVTLALCTTMRHHAPVMTGRTRTAKYPEPARKRLGEAVMQARLACGFQWRPDFVKAVDGIKSVRSITMLENGEPGVGPAVLYAVARYLPNWTEDTPRIILEGGPIPPAQPAPSGSTGEWAPVLTDEQIITMDRISVRKHYFRLEEEYGEEAADDWLVYAASIRRDARRAARSTPAADGS